MIEQWLSQLGYIAMVVIGFGFLIFVHEFGHFIFAKWKGVSVFRLSLGFGPVVVRFRKGETEYALSLIPLGGYCKLAGDTIPEKEEETEEEADVPAERLLRSKTIGERAQIFAAGALVNFLVAFPLGVLMASIGSEAPIAKVTVGPGSAYTAGIHTGDLVANVNGQPVHYWSEMEDAIEGAPINEPFPVTVERERADGVETRTYQVVRTGESDDLGLQYYMKTTIGFVHPISAARKAGLKSSDEIVAVARLGEPAVSVDDWKQFEQIVSSSPGTQIVITVRRENSTKEGGYETIEIPVTPDKKTRYAIGAEYTSDPVVGAVQGDSPAALAGIHPDDRITTINGAPIRDWSDITEAIGQAGLMVPVTLIRDGREIGIVVERQTQADLIGIAASGSDLMIGDVEEASPAQKAGLMAGDIIVRIDGKDVGGKHQRARFESAEEHTIEVRRGHKLMTLTATPREEHYGKVAVWSAPASEFRRSSLLGIIPEGVGKTTWLFSQTFKALYGLLVGEVSKKKLIGPVGIISMSYMQAQTGLHEFVRFMMIITVSLGVFNLLPIPVLDGGRITFLLIEGIKGRPVSERTFVAAQYVGLALLLGLVLYVTGNDVVNFIL